MPTQITRYETAWLIFCQAFVMGLMVVLAGLGVYRVVEAICERLL